jgi:hypothetical protein
MLPVTFARFELALSNSGMTNSKSYSYSVFIDLREKKTFPTEEIFLLGPWLRISIIRLSLDPTLL